MDKRMFPGVHKLLKHPKHLKLMQEGGIVAPIHVSVWPTIKCQLKCSYCCCKNTPRSSVELNLGEFKRAVDVLEDYGTKAIEFSGGGEPLLWEPLQDALDYINCKLSLITNGIAFNNLPNTSIKRFSWIRVSLQSLAHAERIDFDRIQNITRVSASYIVTRLSDIPLYHAFAVKRGIIIRVAVPHPCSEEQETLAKALTEKMGHPLFFTKKEAGTPKGCYMPWIRGAIDWEGNFLPCPSTQLNSETEGVIAEKFKLCHITELDQWLHKNTVHDLGHRCAFCNCGKENNDFVHDMLSEVEDAEFV